MSNILVTGGLDRHKYIITQEKSYGGLLIVCKGA
jgi:hypothetical protein